MGGRPLGWAMSCLEDAMMANAQGGLQLEACCSAVQQCSALLSHLVRHTDALEDAASERARGSAARESERLGDEPVQMARRKAVAVVVFEVEELPAEELKITTAELL